MSFILDALRRAEAQRGRSAVPRLDAQPLPALADDAEAAARRGPGLWIVLGVGLGLLLPLGAWLMFGQPDEPVVAQGVPAQQGATSGMAATQPITLASPGTAAPAAAPAAPMPVSGPSGPPARPAPPTSPDPSTSIAATAPAATAAPPARAPIAPPAVAPVAARPDAAPARTARADRTAEATGKRPEAAPAQASASEPRLLTVAELPDDVRRGLPAMAIGGSIYSKDPASRYVIIDGQLLREKDDVAPGVTIEQIRQKSAVLVTRGYRFSIGI